MRALEFDMAARGNRDAACPALFFHSETSAEISRIQAFSRSWLMFI